MDANTTTGLDLLLEEVGTDTPLGILKLESIWPDLSLEYQLEVLNKLNETNKHVPLSVLSVILKHNTPLIKNVAVRFSSLRPEIPEEAALLRDIENDQDDLVKYAVVKAPVFGIDPEPFSKMPHTQKLALLASADCPFGQQFAEIVRYLIQQNIDEGHLYELVTQFANNKQRNRSWETTPYEGYDWYSQLQDFESLWKLVLDLPSGYALPLIENLQTMTADGDDVPEDILGKLGAFYVTKLLYREDVGLIDFRRKVFFDKSGQYDDFCKSAACSRSFRINEKELNTLFETKEEALIENLCLSTSLLPVQYLALETYLASLPDTKGYTFASAARTSFERRIEQIIHDCELSEKDVEEVYRQIHLFKMAETILPWGKTTYNWKKLYLDEDTLYLKDVVKSNTTWGVYMDLRKQREREDYEGPLEKKLLGYFGPYDEYGEPPERKREREAQEHRAEILEKLEQSNLRLGELMVKMDSQIKALRVCWWLVGIVMLVVLFQIWL